MALHPSRESYFEFSGSTVMLSKAEQLLKGLVPMSVTDAGMATEVNPEFINAELPMEVSPLGNSMVVKA